MKRFLHLILVLFFMLVTNHYVAFSGPARGWRVCKINPWFEGDVAKLKKDTLKWYSSRRIILSGPKNDWLTGALMLNTTKNATVTVFLKPSKRLKGRIQLRVMGQIKTRDGSIIWDPIMTPAEAKEHAKHVPNGESIKDFPKLKISPETSAIIWLTIDLRNIPAGKYRSKLKFTDNAGKVKLIPLNVNVLQAEIPIENPLYTWGWQHTGENPEIIRDMVEHGLSVFHTNPVASWKNGAKFGMFFFEPSWQRKPITEKKKTEVKKRLDEIWEIVEKNKIPLNRWAIQLADEVSDSSYKIDVEYAKLVKAYRPKTPICFNPSWSANKKSTSYSSLDGVFKGIAPYCDIWLPHSCHLWRDKDIYKFIKSQGKRFWFYEVWGSRRPNLGREVFRIGPYIAWRHKLTGFGIYAFNAWYGPSRWIHDRGGINYSVIYSQNGPPISSRGYEVFRQGIQEYKKLYTLKKLGMSQKVLDKWVNMALDAKNVAVFEELQKRMNNALVLRYKFAKNKAKKK